MACFKDDFGLLRVKCKFKSWKDFSKYPILLPKDHQLTEKLILEYHERFYHSGCYAVLSRLRKSFFIPCNFSTAKKALKKCVSCRRFNNSTIKTNQSTYRDFRISPPNVCFKYVFMDFLGPIYVKLNGVKTKIYVLCICCLWSKAINLKIVVDMTTAEFLLVFLCLAGIVDRVLTR